MNRSAVAVLLILFLLSTVLPGAVAPLDVGQDIMLDHENPGTTEADALFDDFSQTFMVRSEPLGQVVTDLNNDSRPDVAVIYIDSKVLDIFYCDQNNKFSFANRTSVTMSNNLTAIIAGDMDKDGKTDLVATMNYTSSNVVILYQGSNFALASGTIFTTNLRPHALALCYLDGDTYLDVVTLFSRDTASYDPGFRVHFYSDGYGLGGVQINLGPSPLNMQMPRLLESGDFNGDGRVDLIIGDHGVGRVVGYVNGAIDGMNWTATISFDISGPTDMMLEQIDGTGLPELVVGADGSSQIKFYHYSAGSFEFLTSINDEMMPISLAAIDHNGDSRMDVARTSSQYNNLTVFDTPTAYPYSYSSSISFPTPYQPLDVQASDMNNDTRTDLVVISRSSSGNGTITIYYQNSVTVSNANDNQFVKDIVPSLATIGDFNGDGSNEVAVYDDSVAQAKVRFVKIGFTNLEERDAPANITSMQSADLNGDGCDELIMTISTPAGARIWFGSSTFMSGGGSQVSLTSTLTQITSATVGDLDNDSDLDLAIGGSGGADVFWSAGSSTLFSSSQHYLLTLAGATVTSITCGQLRSYNSAPDDLLDLALVNSNSSRIEIYFQQVGASKFGVGFHQYLSSLPIIGQVSSADLNSDGLDDLIISTDGVMRLYLQNLSYPNGFDESQPVKTLTVSEGVESYDLGDLNDDGFMELAVATKNSIVLAYEFDGTNFVMLTRQTAGASPLLLMADDMDDDLKDDLVVYSIPSRATSFFYQNNFSPTARGEVEGIGHLEGELVWFNANNSTDNYSDLHRLTYAWDFDDGTIGAGNRASHVFQQNGQYNVTLNVSDLWGGWDETAIQVIIGDQVPEANFSFQLDPTPVEGSPVQFIDLSTSPSDLIVRWEWDFGDGNWLNQTANQSVPHSYGWNGTFTVTLTVVDIDGSEDPVTKEITVLDSAPAADFAASSYSPIEGQEVTISDRSAFTADAIVSWSWDLGDGVWINATNNGTVHHTYGRNGTYMVTLTVADIDGSENSTTKEIEVLDSAPTADFVSSIDSPSEGQEVAFSDRSDFDVNPIVKWTWDLGDGTWRNETSNVTVQHTYADNGTYLVTLIVTDVDGNVHSFTSSLVVKDTSPLIVRLYTSDGLSTYQEWHEINYAVIATAGWDDITKYQWDFQTTSFQVDNETTLNSTYYRYISSGSYKVTVRVWDSDSYAETYIMLTITDPVPAPDFTVVATDNPREIRFSGALTVDTENDQSILMYRWFFGDGQQTAWNLSYEVTHVFQQDGIYSVRLEVKDDHNSAVFKTRNVTIDLLPPVISITDPVLKAKVGELILVQVNVTDLVGIGSVKLEYTIDNVTRTVTMTSEGDNLYFGQIPAQNKTVEITYRIIAEDSAGHVSYTDPFTIAVEYEDSSLFMLTSALLLIALLVLLIYLFLSRPIVDEVFVMYHDGTLLAHQTRRLKPGMDDEILGGMLIALQNFVRDSFKDESSTVLRRMDFGERKLLVERKDDFFMAVVLSGKRAGSAPQRMLRVLDNIEVGYADVLKEWDGDLEKVRGIRDETKPVFNRANPLDRLKRKDGDSL